jgi:hypothetical protein
LYTMISCLYKKEAVFRKFSKKLLAFFKSQTIQVRKNLNRSGNGSESVSTDSKIRNIAFQSLLPFSGAKKRLVM